jgi:hypothetical protein
MDTEALIDKLAREGGAVRPLRSALWLASTWTLAAAAAVLTLNAVVFHCRGDIGESWYQPRLLLSLLSLIGVVGFGAQTAFQSGFPGRARPDFSRRAYRVCLLAFIATLLWPLTYVKAAADWEAGRSELGLGCTWILLSLSVFPTFLVFHSLRRLAPLDPRRTARVAGTAAAAIGAFGLSLDCTIVSPTHFMLYHAIPLVAFAWCCGFLGSRWLRW